MAKNDKGARKLHLFNRIPFLLEAVVLVYNSFRYR
ncbi:Uncharacterised protein [Vibrio cholerae]|nr:Uncharacterised protein [Vibrio cholerae]